MCYPNSEDLKKLNSQEINSLFSKLNLNQSQVSKFQHMFSNLQMNQYKQRSSTAVFGSIQAESNTFSIKKEEKTESTRYFDQKQELNLKLKEELNKAQEKIVDLEKKIRNSREIVLNECKHNTNIDRNLTGKSFDSARMRSTLHNMDIEEICKCFARIIENHCLKQAEKVNPVIQKFHSIFIDENEIPPDTKNVYNWCRNIIAKGKINKESVVNAIVYLERYLEQSKLAISKKTWKKLVFISIFLASKENYPDHAFFEMYGDEEVQRMENAFLTLIEYNLIIKQSEYAHAYFLLRTYASAKDKSAPVKVIEAQKVMQLQKGIPNIEENSKVSFLKSM